MSPAPDRLTTAACWSQLRGHQRRPANARRQAKPEGDHRSHDAAGSEADGPEPGAQARPLHRRVRHARDRADPEGGGLRFRSVRHRAFRLRLRDHQERAALHAGGRSADHRARAIEGIPSHRARRRHGRRGPHAADGGLAGGGALDPGMPEVRAARQARRGARHRARPLSARADLGEARGGQSSGPRCSPRSRPAGGSRTPRRSPRCPASTACGSAISTSAARSASLASSGTGTSPMRSRP